MYKPEHFQPYEWLPKYIYYSLKFNGELYKAYYMMDDRVLKTAEQLRKRFETAIVNTWHFSELFIRKHGYHQYRGFRPADCTVGAEHSQHKYGRGLDMMFPTLKF